MSLTVAVTGVTGFIGRVLAHRLHAENCSVRGLTRPTSNITDLPTGLIQVSGSLEDDASLESLVHGADAVIHCAGVVRGATKAAFYSVNTQGTHRIAELAAAQRPIPRFLLISSLAARHPELSPYAASKRDAERALMAVTGDMPRAIFRPPAVYGPGDRELLPLFLWMRRGIAPSWGTPGARFSLLYVEDLAAAIAKWVTGQAPRATFELDDGTPQGYTMDDVVEIAKQLHGRDIRRLRIPEATLDLLANLNLWSGRTFGYAPMLTPWKLRELRHPRWVCDNNALSSAIDWVPGVHLLEGMRLTLDTGTA